MLKHCQTAGKSQLLAAISKGNLENSEGKLFDQAAINNDLYRISIILVQPMRKKYFGANSTFIVITLRR